MLGWLEDSGIKTKGLMGSLGCVDWEAKMEQIISVLITEAGNVIGTAISVVFWYFLVFSGIVTVLFSLIFPFIF